MKPLRGRYFWLLILVLGVLVHACKDNSTNSNGDPEQEPTEQAPVITDVDPNSGKLEELVTIQGNNFGATSADNTVTFNGVEADVLFSSTNQLLVEVPRGAGDGPVVVNTGGESATGPDFDYLLTYTVSTYAGTGVAGDNNSGVSTAQFNLPYAVALDQDGNLFVSDFLNHQIRKITPEGTVSLLAGSTLGYADGTGFAAQFNLPAGLAMGPSGDLYVADSENHMIRKITPAGEVTTVAGVGTAGFQDGVNTTAQFNQPVSLDVDADGNVYVADRLNHRIRKISSSGEVTTVAGDGTSGYQDGEGTSAQFSDPFDILRTSSGDFIVADHGNRRIRQISQDSVVSTLAGTGTMGFADGALTQAEFGLPSDIAIDENGIIYVIDRLNHNVRMLVDEEVTTIAGYENLYGYIDGDGAEARFNTPYGMDVNSDESVMYVADGNNNVIRKVTWE